ncbi:MAG TPA: hypothetical protein VGS61_07610, partial [Acidimicrobiales bacterium]|nr:hypothetical protein [Acidimicrobiales bacterium]
MGREGGGLALARLRARSEWRRHWRGYAGAAIVVGVLTGVSLAAIAGAQRTQSSFATYLASTNPTETQVGTAIASPEVGTTHGYDPARNELVGDLPGVRAWADVVIFNANVNVIRPARLRLPPGEAPASLQGSTNGEYTRLDRVTLVAGHLFTPGHPDQVVMDRGAARQMGLRLGGTFRLAFYSDAALLANSNTAPPVAVVTLKLVGIVIFNDQVVTDDVESLGSQTVLFSPALTRRLAPCCSYFSGVSLQVPGGAGQMARVGREIERVDANLAGLGGLGGPGSKVVAADERAGRALRPESSALYVFGVVAGLAALIVGAQVLARLRRAGARDRRVLRALGASRV